jgi:hypothetical protein
MTLPRPILGNWLHWRIGPVHVGAHRHGDCWRVLSWPKRRHYFGGSVTYYTWWRLFVGIDC